MSETPPGNLFQYKSHKYSRRLNYLQVPYKCRTMQLIQNIPRVRCILRINQSPYILNASDTLSTQHANSKQWPFSHFVNVQKWKFVQKQPYMSLTKWSNGYYKGKIIYLFREHQNNYANSRILGPFELLYLFMTKSRFSDFPITFQCNLYLKFSDLAQGLPSAKIYFKFYFHEYQNGKNTIHPI